MCYNSYDRLIDLAKRTGDRLIVHDPIQGRDVVIMDVEEYKKIINCVDRRKGTFESKNCMDVRSMSSDQMLDQINRDIAIWRSEKEAEEEWEREMALEDEFETEPPFDPFAEQDYHPADWHSHPEDFGRGSDPWHRAGNVLGDRYNEFSNTFHHEFEDEDDLEKDEEDDEFDFNFDSWNDNGKFDWKEDNANSLDFSDMDEEIKIEDIPFDSKLNNADEDFKNIPLSDSQNFSESWKEEPLGDEDPVFYEEPV